MSSRCRTSGNIPGLPRGIWPFTRSRWRSSTSISPSSNSTCCLQQLYLHPTGQIPAYEWNFSDVNPPVQAWATIFLYRMEQALRGKTDLDFLKRVFGKLTSNFGWWVNRKDRFGKKSVRRRLSRARQYRRVRPQRAIADRRPSGAGRRHGLDRPVLPEHARDRLRACGARSDL